MGAFGFQLHVEVGVWASPERVDQRLTSLPALKAAECVGREDNRFFSPMHGDVLWPVCSGAAQDFA
jgi:hypothetical protein